MRGWPASERCFARESSSRRTREPSISDNTVYRTRITASMTASINFLLTNRIPRVALCRAMGWFSKVEQPLVARAALALWRTVRRLTPRGGEEEPLHQPARLLHPRAEGRRAPGRRRSLGPRQPLRCDRRRLRTHRRHPGLPGEGVALRTRRSAQGRGAVREVPRWDLRNAAHHLEHVPPLPRAVRPARVAGHSLPWRRLEREPAGAEPRGEALLQERARRDPHDADERLRPAAGPRRRDPGGGHPLCTSLPARPSPRARRWAGSSTARPSWCSRRAASACLHRKEA